MIKKFFIGGVDRPISYNFNCLEEFEERTGINPLNGLGKISAKMMKVLIFCGLKYGMYPEGIDDKDLDFNVQKVGSWLDAAAIVKAMEIFNNQGQPEASSEKKSDTVISQTETPNQ